MKVAELIAELQKQDPEAEVHFCYNYGDHAQTIVAPQVEDVSEGYVIHSDYHGMPRTLDLEVEDKQDKAQEVVLLNAR